MRHPPCIVEPPPEALPESRRRPPRPPPTRKGWPYYIRCGRAAGGGVVYSRATPGGWPAWRLLRLPLTLPGPPLAAGLRDRRYGLFSLGTGPINPYRRRPASLADGLQQGQPRRSSISRLVTQV